MPVKGGIVGSVKKLTTALKRGSGEGFIVFLKADEEFMARFLTEPDAWFHYYEHYVDGGFIPCSDDCDACEDGNKPSERYLANVLDVEAGKVVPLKIPISLANDLVAAYNRRGTLTDRDYALIRTGSGKNDTTYSAINEDPRKINLGKYELLDLADVLNTLLEGSGATDDDDDDEPPARTSRRSARPESSGRSARPTRRPARNTEPDDDDDEDDDDEEPARPARRPLKRPGQARAEKEAAVRKPVRKPVRRAR